MNLTPPIIHVYTLCKNEIEILPFFLSHYKDIAAKIVVYDNGSTDGSIQFIEGQVNCELRTFNTNNELRDDILMFIKNSVWKESRGVADWVIVSDIDEFLFHKTLVKELVKYKAQGITIPSVVGFNMVSENFPIEGVDLTLQVMHGAYSKQFSKNIIFDPNKIVEINYSPGGHSIEPEGKVVFGGALKLLHYKYLGPSKRLQKRWGEIGQSLSTINIENKWGTERVKPDVIISRYETVKKNSERVVDFSFWEWRLRLENLFKLRDRSVKF